VQEVASGAVKGDWLAGWLDGWGQSLWSHHVEKHLITLEELLCWHKSVKCLATPLPMPLLVH